MYHKSLSVLRTNPSLTSNVKIVVNNSYELFLESFDSNKTLGDSRFKHFRINKEDFLFVKIPEFYKNVPEDIAFGVKFDDDQSVMFDDYVKQFDDIYFSGCSNIEDTWYKEEFECFAPLYINPKKIPSNIFIFRVDGSGIIDLNKSNFKQEILDKLKCVTHFDLGKTTPLGQFLDRNFNYKYFPKNGLEIDFKEYEFSRWNGIDYIEGGYSNKSKFLFNELKTETPFFEFEKNITEGYKRNQVVHPNMLNLKFLFDDTPATPDSLRKYSINRYLGFYADSIVILKTLSSYEPPKLIDLPPRNIVNNIFFDIAMGGHYDPIEGGWKEGKTYYVFFKGVFHLLRRVKLNNNLYQYKIISDMLFDTIASGHNTNSFNKINPDVNNSIIRINYNSNTLRNEIILSDGTPFSNSINYVDIFSRASLHLLKIDGKFHVVQYDQIKDVYYLTTDYSINANQLTLKYFINSSDPSYTVTKSVSQVSDTIRPITFELYRVEFTEIVDFDNDLINTDFSWFEYDAPTSFPNNHEIKLYAIDQSGNSQPKLYLTDTPVSSEYIADDEIYELKTENVLSDIWRKNDIYVKWGYQGSISQNDQPYRLDNNFKFAGIYNRTASPFNTIPDRSENNLDYFYVFQPPVGNFINHSLHLEATNFDINAYINGSSGVKFDYFDYLFKVRQVLDGGSIVRNSHKYSTFNYPIGNEAYHTVFRGIKLEVYDLKNVKKDSNNFITEMSIGSKRKTNISSEPLITFQQENKNDYSNYKFSIIFSAKTYRINDTKNGFTIVTNSWINYKKSGIDIYVNRKYRHILVHIYIYNDTVLLDVNAQLRDDLYNLTNISGSTLTPHELTLANFRFAIDDPNNFYGFDLGISYWEIKEDGTFDYTQDFRPINFSQSNLPPAILKADYPDALLLDKDSWFVEPFVGPSIKIYNGLSLSPRQPLARIFHYNGKQPTKVGDPYNNADVTNPSNTQKDKSVGSQGILQYDIQLFRFSGPYAPIFKYVQLFKSYEILPQMHPYESGNYLFDFNLTSFGLNTEQKISKINHKGSILKLRKDKRNKSVYPMIDEFGYSLVDMFMFKSTWDLNYHYITIENYIPSSTS